VWEFLAPVGHLANVGLPFRHPMSDRGSAAKRWVFTLNNPEPFEFEHPLIEKLRLFVNDGTAVYFVVGRETGASGTPHFQGYLELSKKQRITWLKSNVDARAHYEVSRGTSAQASDYCKEDGDFVEGGEIRESRQGSRTDIQKAKDLFDAGKGLDVVAEECFGVYLKYQRALSAYVDLRSIPRKFVTEVFVYYGATGTGKTRRVWEQEDDLWVACDNSLKWFDGYTGQRAVLFDDFVSVKNSRFGFLLQLLDRYPLKVPVKGGFVNWRPERVYFTSNLPVEQWYTGVTEAQARALRRRITHQVHFHNGLVGWTAQTQSE